MKTEEKSMLEKIFKLKENKTDVKTEVLGGLTTFVTIAYALLVVPNILKLGGMNSLGLKGDEAAALTIAGDPVVGSAFASVCIAAAIGTLIMAFYANMPFVLAPGLGLVSFFAFNICLKLGYTWQQGLAAVSISGILFIVITLTSIREKIVYAMPHNLKLAITAGIGLFISLIGLKSGGIIGAILTIFMVVITLSLVDLFDTLGTLVGTAQTSGMIDENGEAKNLRKSLFSDAMATTLGGFLGTTTLATVVESAAGIAAGARTGLSNVIVSILFIFSLFFSGLVGIVPQSATAPALIIVGVLMLSAVKEIDFSDFTEAVPAFFTIAMMPFTYSIANGIAVGMIFYPLMKLFTGKKKEVHLIMYIMTVLFILRFVLMPD